MPSKAARKSLPPKAVITNREATPDTAEDSPNKQLALEATARAHLEDAPDFLQQNGKNKRTYSRDKESVGILARNTNRQAAKKLNAPRKAEIASRKRGRAAQDEYDLDSDSDEGAGEEAERPPTPPVTRQKTTEATASPRKAVWTKRDDDRLRRLIAEGLSHNAIHDQLPQFTLDEIKARANIISERQQSAPAVKQNVTASPRTRRSRRVIEASKSPAGPKQALSWTKRDDGILSKFIEDGTKYSQIYASMPQFHPKDIDKRMELLFEQQRDVDGAQGDEAEEEREEDEEEAQEAEDAITENAKATTRVKSWTREEEDRLLQMWQERYTVEAMLPHFPGRTKSALYSRHTRLDNLEKAEKRASTEPLESPKKRTKVDRRKSAVTPELGENLPDKPVTPRSARATRRTRGAVPESPPAATSIPDSEPESSRKTRSHGPAESEGLFVAEESQQDDGSEDEDDPDEALPSLEALQQDAGDLTFADNAAQIDDAQGDEDGSQAREARTSQSQERDPPLQPDLDLYGQTERISKIFEEAIKHEEETHKGEFDKRNHSDYPSVKAIRMVRDHLQKLFNTYASTNDIDKCRENIDVQLEKLVHLIKRLDVEKLEEGDKRQRVKRQRFFTQLNKRTVIDLLTIFNAAIQAHAATQFDDEESKAWELNAWITICHVTVNLHDRMLKWGEKGKRWTFEGVQNIRVKLLAPLRVVEAAFVRENKRYRATQQRSAASEQAAIASQAKKDKDEEEARLAKEYDDKYRRLRGLFVYRQNAARVRNPALSKFRMSMKTEDEWRRDQGFGDEDEMQEVDSDGRPIERVDVFGRRRHPPHRATRDGVDEVPWAKKESLALLEGLRELHGSSQLFREVFVYYCQPGQDLSQRTVSEILKRAAAFVDTYKRRADAYDEDERKPCPEWLENLPDLDLLELLW